MTLPILAALLNSDAATVGHGALHAAAIVALAVAGGVLYFVGRRRLAGTTLRSAVPWGITALAAVLAVEVAAVVQGDSARWIPPARLAAAVGTLAPAVSVLGAKRPQHRAWQWIVAAFWLVGALPAVTAILFRGGGPVEMHAAQAVFLAGAAAAGALNWLFTRYWPSALLAAVAHFALLAPHQDLAPSPLGLDIPLPATATLVAAMALAACGFPPRARPACSLDAEWLDFRDRYGAFWGLRVLVRLNGARGQSGGGTVLTWSGFCHAAGAAHSVEAEQSARKLLQSLLRRFRLAPLTGENSGGPSPPSLGLQVGAPQQGVRRLTL